MNSEETEQFILEAAERAREQGPVGLLSETGIEPVTFRELAEEAVDQRHDSSPVSLFQVAFQTGYEVRKLLEGEKRD